MDDRPILVAFDLSEGSTEALKFAIEIARSATAPLHLVSVIKAPVQIGTHGMAQYRPEQDREEYLKRVAAENWDLTVAFSVLSGPTVDAILGVAEKVQPRYLILGRRSRSKLARLFSSSTSEELSQRCWFPVLSVGCPPEYAPTPAQPPVERPDSLQVPPALWQRVPAEAQSIIASEWEAIEGWVLQLEDRLRASEGRVPSAAAPSGGVPTPAAPLVAAPATARLAVPAEPSAPKAAAPSAPEAAPSAPEAAPSAPEAAPSAPEAAPSAPEAAPSAPEAAPSAPEAAPSAPEAAPSAPEAAPSAPEAGAPAVEPGTPEADEAGQADPETGPDESDDGAPKDRPAESPTASKKRKKRR